MQLPLSQAMKDIERTNAKRSRADYDQLLVAATTGKVVKPEVAVGILKEVGKSTDDFDRDVAARKTRIELRKQLDAGSKAEATRQEAQTKREECKARFAPLREKFEAEMSGYSAKINEAARAISAAFDAELTLRRTCTNPDVLEERKAINATRADLDKKRAEVQSLAERADGNVQTVTAWLESARDPRLQKKYESELAAVKARRDEYTKQLGEIEAELQALNEREAANDKRALEP